MTTQKLHLLKFLWSLLLRHVCKCKWAVRLPVWHNLKRCALIVVFPSFFSRVGTEENQVEEGEDEGEETAVAQQ